MLRGSGGSAYGTGTPAQLLWVPAKAGQGLSPHSLCTPISGLFVGRVQLFLNSVGCLRYILVFGCSEGTFGFLLKRNWAFLAEHQELISRPPTSENLFLKRCCCRRCCGYALSTNAIAEACASSRNKKSQHGGTTSSAVVYRPPPPETLGSLRALYRAGLVIQFISAART
jgi:hypothetical protein